MNRPFGGPFCLIPAAAVIMLLLAAGGVYAHDIWIEKSSGGYVLLYGHAGHGGGESEIVEYDPADVVRAICIDRAGTGVEAKIQDECPLRIGGSFASIYVLTSSGYWSETPFGLKNLPKDEAKSPIRSWLSFESVKRIDVWGDGTSSPLTEDLEITPVRNPLILSRGDKVRLFVTIGGKPAAGVPVAYFDSTRGITDRKGRINIRLKFGGMQLIKATLKEPGDGVKEDEIVHTTTLVFEIEEE